MRKKVLKWLLWAVGLFILMVLISLFSLSIGPANISLKRILYLIVNGDPGAELSILMDIRLPRIILGIAIGGALSLCGAVLQGLFRNPLVEPFSLGISGGAALGASLCIALRLNTHAAMLSLPACGFLGAMVVMVLLYLLNVRKGFVRIHGILLTGVMISFISGSLIMLIMSISRAEDLYGITFWIMGSLQEGEWVLVKSALAVSVFGLCAVCFFSHDLNALCLGEEEAKHLGVDVERTKRSLIFITSLLTGFAVSVSGIIGFVGLIVPHFMRMFVGRDYRILSVSSFLCGAGFLVLCDTIARSIVPPLELPVGIITGILGGSVFIYTLTKNNSV